VRPSPSLSAELGGCYLNGFEDSRTENGSSQDQNLSLTVVIVPPKPPPPSSPNACQKMSERSEPPNT